MSAYLEWKIPLLLLLFVATANTVQAQQVASTFDQLRFVVRPGDKVTVTESTGQRTTGRIDHLSESSLALLTRGRLRSLSETEIATVTRRRHGNLAVGAAIGLLGGAVIGASLMANECWGCGAEELLIAAMFFGGAGTGLGVGVSALTWRNQVIFDRVVPSSKKVRLEPVLGRDRQLIGLSIKF